MLAPLLSAPRTLRQRAAGAAARRCRPEPPAPGLPEPAAQRAQALPEGRATNEIRRDGPPAARRPHLHRGARQRGHRRDRRRLFDPFFTTKPVGVGTGPAGHVCHDIVVGLGGEMGVDSAGGAVAPSASCCRSAKRRSPPLGMRARVLHRRRRAAPRHDAAPPVEERHDVVSSTRGEQALRRVPRASPSTSCSAT